MMDIRNNAYQIYMSRHVGDLEYRTIGKSIINMNVTHRLCSMGVWVCVYECVCLCVWMCLCGCVYLDVKIRYYGIL